MSRIHARCRKGASPRFLFHTAAISLTCQSRQELYRVTLDQSTRPHRARSVSRGYERCALYDTDMHCLPSKADGLVFSSHSSAPQPTERERKKR